jgi:hypothetical protein
MAATSVYCFHACGNTTLHNINKCLPLLSCYGAPRVKVNTATVAVAVAVSVPVAVVFATILYADVDST